MADKSCVAKTVVVNDCVAGNVGCWTQDGQRLIGYWLGKEFWGKGVATKMLRIFLDAVTDRPLYAYVVHHNAASIRVLEKCGFVRCDSVTAPHFEADEGVVEVAFILATPNRAIA